jgi:hypothetical protein
MYKNDWQGYYSKELVKTYGENRKVYNAAGERVGNNIVILCQNEFTDFLRPVRNSLIDNWIICIDRGLAVCLMKSNQQGIDDPFNLRKLSAIVDERVFRKGGHLKDLALDDWRQIYGQHPNFSYFIEFQALPAPIMELYYEFDRKAKDDLDDESDKEAELGPQEAKTRTKLGLASMFWAVCDNSTLEERAKKIGMSAGGLSKAEALAKAYLANLKAKEIKPNDEKLGA